tara:strand:+ start:4338 stop:5309 length:972 start_codon:yes stop_codon:yes gene_type:complete
MDLRKLLPITILVLFSQAGFSHDSECLNLDGQEFSRPCIERLIPRSLDAENNMLTPMEKPLIVVIGASGRTGRFVLEGLANKDVRIRALSRNIERASADISGNYEWVQADVTQPETLVMAFQGSDIIISTIGAKPGKGPDGPESVVYKGVINLVDEAKRAGARHIIYMSSIGAGGAENFSTTFLNLFMNKTLKWKSLGEEYMRNSGIDFTIIRPGGLRGEPGVSGIKFGQGDEIMGYIPREDVAEVMIESAFNLDAVNKTFEIINDENLPVGAWRDEFKNLKTGEYGTIASGNLPVSYWVALFVLLILIVVLIRRRRMRKKAA